MVDYRNQSYATLAKQQATTNAPNQNVASNNPNGQNTNTNGLQPGSINYQVLSGQRAPTNNQGKPTTDIVVSAIQANNRTNNNQQAVTQQTTNAPILLNTVTGQTVTPVPASFQEQPFSSQPSSSSAFVPVGSQQAVVVQKGGQAFYPVSSFNKTNQNSSQEDNSGKLNRAAELNNAILKNFGSPVAATETIRRGIDKPVQDTNIFSSAANIFGKSQDFLKSGQGTLEGTNNPVYGYAGGVLGGLSYGAGVLKGVANKFQESPVLTTGEAALTYAAGGVVSKLLGAGTEYVGTKLALKTGDLVYGKAFATGVNKGVNALFLGAGGIEVATKSPEAIGRELPNAVAFGLGYSAGAPELISDVSVRWSNKNPLVDETISNAKLTLSSRTNNLVQGGISHELVGDVNQVGVVEGKFLGRPFSGEVNADTALSLKGDKVSKLISTADTVYSANIDTFNGKTVKNYNLFKGTNKELAGINLIKQEGVYTPGRGSKEFTYFKIEGTTPIASTKELMSGTENGKVYSFKTNINLGTKGEIYGAKTIDISNGKISDFTESFFQRSAKESSIHRQSISNYQYDKVGDVLKRKLLPEKSIQMKSVNTLVGRSVKNPALGSPRFYREAAINSAIDLGFLDKEVKPIRSSKSLSYRPTEIAPRSSKPLDVGRGVDVSSSSKQLSLLTKRSSPELSSVDEVRFVPPRVDVTRGILSLKTSGVRYPVFFNSRLNLPKTSVVPSTRSIPVSRNIVDTKLTPTILSQPKLSIIPSSRLQTSLNTRLNTRSITDTKLAVNTKLTTGYGVPLPVVPVPSIPTPINPIGGLFSGLNTPSSKKSVYTKASGKLKFHYAPSITAGLFNIHSNPGIKNSVLTGLEIRGIPNQQTHHKVMKGFVGKMKKIRGKKII